jgi:hypothetical protein
MSPEVMIMLKWPTEKPSVRPVYRRAILSVVSPRLTRGRAAALAARFGEHCAARLPELKQVLAQACDNPNSGLAVEEGSEFRVRNEGSTIVLDSPRLRLSPGRHPDFDTRLCTAFCTEGLTTKSWVRVSIHYGPYLQRSWVPLDKKELFLRLDRIAKKCSEWSFHRLRSFLKSYAPHVKAAYTNELDIRVMGSNEKRLNIILNSSGPYGMGLGHTTASSTILRVLEKYVRCATAASRTPGKTIPEESDDTFWMHLPLYVANKRGTASLRETLFLNMPDGQTINSVGVGFDDSRLGDLSSAASLHMARWFGKRV